MLVPRLRAFLLSKKPGTLRRRLQGFLFAFARVARSPPMPDSPVDSKALDAAAGVDLPHRRPIWELLALAGPTIAQMASYTLMQFIDTWILTRLGVTAPAAAANAGMISFSAISLGMGIMFVVNTLVSQSFGRRDPAGCGRYLR